MAAAVRKLVIVDPATRELWRVAESGAVSEVTAILSRKVNVDARNEHGMTALMRAARQGHAEVVRTLLEYGADPNITRNDKFTALALAAFFGHTETVRILIEHGAKTEVVTRSGTSPRMWATARTFTEAARCLEKSATVRRAPAPIAAAPVPVSTAPPVVRILKDPPEIWDLVQEVPKGFNPRTAFFSRLKSMKWAVGIVAFVGLLLVIAGGVAWLVLRDPEAGNLTTAVPPAQIPATAVAVPPPPVPVESPDIRTPVPASAPAPAVVTSVKTPVRRESKSKPRAVDAENIVAVAPENQEPQAATPVVEKPKPSESPVKSPPNAGLSPHLIAPARKAKVIRWP